jgi:FkbM family methyltransferase
VESFPRRLFYFLYYRLKEAIHPRALVWRFKRQWRPGQPIITRMIDGLKVRLYPEDIIGRDIFIHGRFEPKETRFVAGFLKPGMIFFDIGANLGQYTLLGAQRVGPKGRVHSFEPNKRMFQELCFNVKLNNFTDRCILNNLAVADKEGVGTMPVYKPGAEVYSSLGQYQVNQYLTGESEEVTLIKLDSYMERHNVEKVDLLKMDIEGAEFLALQGAQSLLARPDAPVIILEVGESNLAGFGHKGIDVWNFLEACGYKKYIIERSGSIIEATLDTSWYGNFVAKKSF